MAENDGRPTVAILDPDDTGARAAVDSLIAAAERATDHPAVAEPSRLAWRDGSGFIGLVVGSAESAVAYGQLTQRDRSFTLELVADPSIDAGPAHGVIVERALALARERGGSELRCWVNRFDGPDDPPLAAHGFEAERDLVQMRVPLPIEGARPPAEPFTLRSFRPGADEGAWLTVNNRAFASHPEQGHWDLTTLRARERTDWFDPDGFLMCEEDGRLAGSCWTKVHHDRDPVLGEIYVVSVDPDFQGRGLGKLLAHAGLDWLAKRSPVGMLYVDGTNTGAIGLYRSLGFGVDHVDRCYRVRL
ncbi:MAG: mycothiol synthase [Acidimicrobiales bacterium]